MSRLAAAILSGLICVASSGVLLAQASQEQTAPEYPQTEDGFNAQIAGAVDLYQKGDTSTGRYLLDQLQLPEPTKWFAEEIGRDQSAALTARYGRFFDDYANSLEKTIEDVVRIPNSQLITHLQEGTREPPRSSPTRKLSGIVPVKEPTLFNCRFAITIDGKDASRWMETFTYENGRFRFVGHGAWPFWDWEDGSEGKAPPGGAFATVLQLRPGLDPNVSGPPFTPGKDGVGSPSCVDCPPPAYTPEARKAKFEGVAVLRVVIQPNGRATDIQVLKSPPFGLKANAIEAVRNWRFKPAQGPDGKPVAVVTPIEIHFRLAPN